jgi:cobalamin biosynthesis Co2+ chelatase CbiK
MSWINLRHLDDAFPDYEKTFKMVEAILETDSKTTVHLLICRSTACSEHVYMALEHFGRKKGYNIRVDAKQHQAYPRQKTPEKRLEIVVTRVQEEEE